ncbi:carbohydrate ABC transporter permease [Vallitalea okinawensis]|uniref:carbohydrate ABC transporter permease n=1 Tax=Vallitalea okinawensis TaxID=2078660 RepID=UPI000CFC4D13|nr:sugar ABC transporter permease [Vallitalea okinawensis]
MNKKKLRYLLDEVVFIGPAFIFFLIIVIIPFIIGMYYSFTSWDGVNDNITWVGLDNFIYLFKDEGFINSFIFTLKFTFVSVIITNLIALLLALVLTSQIKTSKVLRTVFFTPNVISGLLLGFVWQFIFVNGFSAIGEMTDLAFFNLPWLGTASTAFWAIIIVSSWQGAGYLMVIYIAGIINIPTDLKEAAGIDGANAFQRFFKVTLPMIMSSITICLFLSISWAFKMFDLNYALTKGGPFNSTKSVALDIYLEAFQNNNYGLGTAKAFVFFIVVAGITALQVKLTKEREVEM